jgi:hypothetical protein
MRGRISVDSRPGPTRLRMGPFRPWFCPIIPRRSARVQPWFNRIRTASGPINRLNKVIYWHTLPSGARVRAPVAAGKFDGTPSIRANASMAKLTASLASAGMPN